jgi:hypothetical protein
MGQLAQEKGFLHPGYCAMKYTENREEKKEEEKEDGKNKEAKGRQDIIESEEGR